MTSKDDSDPIKKEPTLSPSKGCNANQLFDLCFLKCRGKTSDYAMLDDATENDNLLFCYKCSRDYPNGCRQHPIEWLINKRLPSMNCQWTGQASTRCPCKNPENHAKCTLPAGLVVCRAGFRGAGLGVWADRLIPKGAMMGPFEGEVVYIDSVGDLPLHEKRCREGYAWFVRKSEGGCRSHFVDATDPAKSNWLRYVNSARFVEERNVIAVQYNGKIYFRACQDIRPNFELLTFYSKHFNEHSNVLESNSLTVDAGSETGKSAATGLPRVTKVSASPELDGGNLSSQDKLGVRSTAGSIQASPSSPSKAHWRCQICDRQFTRQSSWTKHQRIHSSNQAVVRQPRQLSGPAAKSKQGSGKSVGKSKSVVCPDCKRTFISNQFLEKHQKIHIGERPFQCGICQTLFGDTDTLTSHVLGHMAKAKHKCPLCPYKAFPTAGLLRRHEISQHPAAKPHKCQECGRQFVLKAHLGRHLRFHRELAANGPKSPPRCLDCGKTFTRHYTLTIHMRIHSGERRFKCGVCGDKFTMRSTLLTHQVLHNGLKKFRCTVCDKTFAQSAALRVHQRVHTGERPYACRTCDKRFADSGTLTKHERLHTGETPYSCLHCESSFARCSDRNNHVRRVHKVHSHQ